MALWYKPAGLTIAIWLLVSPGCERSAPVAEPPVPDLSEAYTEVAEFVRDKAAAVRLVPTSAVAWGEYAMALDAHEYRNEAIRCYETASELGPTDVRWKYLLALRIKESDVSQAASLLGKLVSGGHGDSDVSIVLHLADLLGQLGKSEELTELLATRLTDTASHPAIIVKLAEQAFADGDAVKTEQLLELLNDDFMESAKLTARLSAQKGFLVEANDQLARALQLPSVNTTISDPYSESLVRFRRDPLWQGKQAADRARSGDRFALMTLEGLVRKHPQLVENRIQLGLLFQAVGRVDMAAQLIDEGLTSSPNDVRLLAARGTLALMNSEWAMAEHFLRKVVENDAYQKSAWADLAFVLEQQQRPAESIAAYQEAIRLNPLDEDLKIRLRNLQRDQAGQSE